MSVEWRTLHQLVEAYKMHRRRIGGLREQTLELRAAGADVRQCGVGEDPIAPLACNHR